MWPCRGACEEAGIKIRGDHESRVCLKPFIDEVHGQNEILFLPDLASAHHALPNGALFDELYIPHVLQEAKPSTSPQTTASGGFLGNPERVGLQGMLGSPNWAPAQAQDEEVPSQHGLRPRPSMSEHTQDRHPLKQPIAHPETLWERFFKKYLYQGFQNYLHCITTLQTNSTQALNIFVIF